MSIEETKKEMINYIDFYGGDILHIDEIKNANSKKQLADIIEKHRDHLEQMARDADRHLDKFKKRIGLESISYHRKTD